MFSRKLLHVHRVDEDPLDEEYICNTDANRKSLTARFSSTGSAYRAFVCNKVCIEFFNRFKKIAFPLCLKIIIKDFLLSGNTCTFCVMPLNT